MLSLDFKRGDTFIATIAVTDGETELPVDITDWEIKSQIKVGYKLVAELEVDVQDAENGEYTLTFEDTTRWPLEHLHCDIQYTDSDNKILSTQTFIINCVRDITQ